MDDMQAPICVKVFVAFVLYPAFTELLKLPVYCWDHWETSSAALGEGSVQDPGLSAGPSCLGSGLQSGGVCKWPCGSVPGERAGAGAAAVPP